MKFTVLDYPQRSPEWFAARCGVLTGSSAADVMATIKSGEAAARRDLRYRIALEMLTGQPVEQDDLSTVPAVQRGIEMEAHARMRFEEETGIAVRETGFILLNDRPLGVSLDGDNGDLSEIIEIKCPKTATHIGYLEDGEIPKRYIWQVTHAALVTGAKRVHFVSFDDRLPDKLAYFHKAADTKDLPVEEYDRAVDRFLKEVYDLHSNLKRMAA